MVFRNYAAHAAKALEKVPIESCQLLSKAYMKAVHFIGVQGGFILDDNLKGLEDITQWALPFESITLEYDISEDIKCCLYAAQDRSLGGIYVHYCISVGKDAWWPSPIMIFYSSDDMHNCMPKLKSVKKIWGDIFGENEATIKDNIKMSGYITRDLLEFVEALSCSNVVIDTLDRPCVSKNIKRVKKGKLPFYEVKILTIKASTNVGIDTINAGFHTSPRQHLRRGHIRKHPTAGKIWVNSCVVGSATNGVLHKIYQLKGQP